MVVEFHLFLGGIDILSSNWVPLTHVMQETHLEQL